MHSYCKLAVGKDCLLSWDIEILCGDGHQIIDVREGRLINSPLDNPETVVIGDHVWIGGECCIMTGALIGTGSVVGYKSTVNKKFPNNVVLAGIPARIVREDAAWVSREWSDAEEYYHTKLPAEYKQLTDPDYAEKLASE